MQKDKIMKKYILYKCADNEFYEKFSYLNQDEPELYQQSWLKVLKFDEILSCLTQSDRKRKDLFIHLDYIDYCNSITYNHATIYVENNKLVLEEDNSDNLLRLILLRLGRIIFLDYRNNYIKTINHRLNI